MKHNPTRYGNAGAVTFAERDIPPRPTEIEGLLTQRGTNSRDKDRDRVSAQSSSKGKYTAKGRQLPEKKVRSFNQSESSEEGRARQYCPSHPSKKAKYFLASNTNIGFCMKCAITMSEREDLIDQEKLTKISQIDKFKESIQKLKQTISFKQQQINNVNKTIEELFRQEMDDLGERFVKMFQNLTEKYESLVERLKQRYEQANKDLLSCQQTLTTTSTTIDNYLTDISKNYQGILNELSLPNFHQIMSQYKLKIQDQTNIIQNCQVRGLEIDHQLELLDLQIGRLSLQDKPKRQSLRARLENKQNNINLANCQRRQPKLYRS